MRTSVDVTGANVPDAQLLATTIEAIVVERPEPNGLQHLCLNKGYDNKTGWGATVTGWGATVNYNYDPIFH